MKTKGYFLLEALMMLMIVGVIVKMSFSVFMVYERYEAKKEKIKERIKENTYSGERRCQYLIKEEEDSS